MPSPLDPRGLEAATPGLESAGRIAELDRRLAALERGAFTIDRGTITRDAVWRPFFSAWAAGGSLNANFLYAAATDGQLSQGQAAARGFQGFPFDPAQYAVAGKTMQLRVNGYVAVNATGVGQIITLGLSTITALGGGVGQLVYTVGGMLAGSGIAFTAAQLAAGTGPRLWGSAFTAPATTLYVPSLLMGGTQAANSYVSVGWQVECRWV